MNASPMKQPSARAPLASSGAALALVQGHAASVGVVHEADEGTIAAFRLQAASGCAGSNAPWT